MAVRIYLEEGKSPYAGYPLTCYFVVEDKNESLLYFWAKHLHTHLNIIVSLRYRDYILFTIHNALLFSYPSESARTHTQKYNSWASLFIKGGPSKRSIHHLIKLSFYMQHFTPYFGTADKWGMVHKTVV